MWNLLYLCLVPRKTCDSMPEKPESDDFGVKHREEVQLPSSIYSHHQPWWLGVGEIENASKSSSADQLTRSIMNGVTYSEANGVDINKQRHPLVSPSLSVTDKSGVRLLTPF